MLGLRRYRGMQLDIWQGDITTFLVDAMVTAANAELSGGGGVDAAIHAVAGPSLLEECRRLGGCAPGNCVVTTAGKLPAKYLLHSVGPIWSGGKQGESQVLTSCYQSILTTAARLGVRHISIPAIATGSYKFPPQLAAEIAMSTIRDCIDTMGAAPLKRITFVAFDGAAYRTLQEQLFVRFPDEIDAFEE